MAQNWKDPVRKESDLALSRFGPSKICVKNNLYLYIYLIIFLVNFTGGVNDTVVIAR